MFVADLHNDVLQRAMIGEDISKKTDKGHSDLVRLNDSCIDLEVFVVWINSKYTKESPFIRANKFFDKLEYLEKENNFIKITKLLAKSIMLKIKKFWQHLFLLKEENHLKIKF